MKTIENGPTLQGYKNMLRALKAKKHKTKDNKELIKELEACIKAPGVTVMTKQELINILNMASSDRMRAVIIQGLIELGIINVKTSKEVTE